jgi:hypothetical protein
MGSDLPISDGDSGNGLGNTNLPNLGIDPEEILLDATDVALRLKVSKDWVWDHSTRRAPYLPAIWLSPGVLRFKPSKIDSFVDEQERLSRLRRKRR